MEALILYEDASENFGDSWQFFFTTPEIYLIEKAYLIL